MSPLSPPPQPSPMHHDRLLDNVAFHNARLASDSKRVFTSSDNISIDVLRTGDAGNFDNSSASANAYSTTTYTSAPEFEQCLLQAVPHNSSRFYTLKPADLRYVSGCQLHISEDLVRRMMAAHHVMPTFLDYLHAYGLRMKRTEDASFGGGRYKLGFAAEAVAQFELCYSIKFPVNRGNKFPIDDGRIGDTNPYSWSIRQTSVYQKFCYRERDAVWILVQPEDAVQTRLRAASEETPAAGNPLKMNLLFSSAACEGWRDYYNHLEKIFYHKTMASVNFQIQGRNGEYASARITEFGGQGNPVMNFKLDFQDLQDLQEFQELLRRVKISLEINEDSIRSLKALNDKLRQLSDVSVASWSEVNTETEQQLASITRHKENFETLLRNAHGRAQLLYNVLDFKNALTISDTSQRAVDIRSLQQNEAALVTMITEMTARDAIGVKILTLLATLYVPASFVATFLDSGVITFDESRSTRGAIDFKRMVVSREITVFYVVFTVILMVLTYGCWWAWDRKASKAVEARVSISRAKLMEPEKGMRRRSMMMSPLTPGISPMNVTQ